MKIPAFSIKTHLLLLILFCTLFSCQNSEVFFEDSLCIENISTIDPEIGLLEDQTIIIKAGKIIQISPSQDLQLAKENTIIDGTDKFMIPGLWDAHIHFSFIKEMAPNMLDLFLAYGITSVRDTGGDIDFVNTWKEISLANPTDAPRVMVAGPLLDGNPNVYDGSDHSHPPLSVGLKTVEDVTNKINELDSLKVDFLKAYEMLTPEQFKEVTKLAKEKGLKVTGHVPLSMDVIGASNAGLNSMEHFRNLELSCASNSDELLLERQELLASGKDDKGGVLRSRIHKKQREVALQNFNEGKADEVLEVLKKNDTWQIPTLTLNTAFARRPFAAKDWQKSFSYLPKNIQEQWLDYINNLVKKEVVPFDKEYAKWMFDMTKRVHHKGIKIMAGTDTPIFFLTPGLSLHEELAVLVEAGLSPLEALKSATTNPAAYFNLENELGKIAINNWADLVILDANPLEDIKNTKQINAVIKQGKYFNRELLDGLLNNLTTKE